MWEAIKQPWQLHIKRFIPFGYLKDSQTNVYQLIKIRIMFVKYTTDKLVDKLVAHKFAKISVHLDTIPTQYLYT